MIEFIKLFFTDLWFFVGTITILGVCALLIWCFSDVGNTYGDY